MAKEEMMKRYVPSGRVAPLALPALLLVGSIAAIAGGWLYQWLISVIPIIYVNFVLTTAFGLLLGACGMVLNPLPTRNVPVAVAATALVGVLGVAASFYFAHRDYLGEVRADLEAHARQLIQEASVAGEDVPDLATTMRILEDANPEHFTFGAYIDFRLESGWGISSRHDGDSGGFILSGTMVYLVWLAEAGLIVVLAGMGGWKVAREPYCENCQLWMVDHPVGALEQLGVTEARAVAQSGSLSDLFEVRTKKSRAATALFTLCDCGGEACPRWLTVNVAWTEGRGSEQLNKSETVVRHMHVSDEELDELLYRIEERQHEDQSPRRI